MDERVVDARDFLISCGVDLVLDEGAELPPTVDARMHVDVDGRREVFDVVVRSGASPLLTSVVVSPGSRPFVVATTTVTAEVAEALRSRGIAFVDAAHNCFFAARPVLIDRTGYRSVTKDRGAERRDRSTTRGGAQVVMCLLSDPSVVSATYERLADSAGVSVGTAHAVMTDLEEAGHLRMSGRHRRLVGTRKLFDRWVEVYALRLAPRLVLGRFETSSAGTWPPSDGAVLRAGAQWGGESAAQRMDGYLRPGRAVLYCPQLPTSILRESRLRRVDDGGDVELRRAFWRLDSPADDLLVPPPLVYADLLASGDPRQAEAADRLRSGDDLLRGLDET